MFDNEDEWIADRNEQWRKLRRGEIDEDTMNARASLLEHPDVYDINHTGRGGWEVSHGVVGPRKRGSVLVRRLRNGSVHTKISPPNRAVWSKDGDSREWTITQGGEGPAYQRTASSLLDAVRVADTPPGPEDIASEEPHERSPEYSPARNVRDGLSDIEDERLWKTTPIARKFRLSSHRVVGAVSRASDTIWRQ